MQSHAAAVGGGVGDNGRHKAHALGTVMAAHTLSTHTLSTHTLNTQTPSTWTVHRHSATHTHKQVLAEALSPESQFILASSGSVTLDVVAAHQSRCTERHCLLAKAAPQALFERRSVVRNQCNAVAAAKATWNSGSRYASGPAARAAANLPPALDSQH